MYLNTHISKYIEKYKNKYLIENINNLSDVRTLNIAPTTRNDDVRNRTFQSFDSTYIRLCN